MAHHLISICENTVTPLIPTTALYSALAHGTANHNAETNYVLANQLATLQWRKLAIES